MRPHQPPPAPTATTKARFTGVIAAALTATAMLTTTTPAAVAATPTSTPTATPEAPEPSSPANPWNDPSALIAPRERFDPPRLPIEATKNARVTSPERLRSWLTTRLARANTAARDSSILFERRELVPYEVDLRLQATINPDNTLTAIVLGIDGTQELTCSAPSTCATRTGDAPWKSANAARTKPLTTTGLLGRTVSTAISQPGTTISTSADTAWIEFTTRLKDRETQHLTVIRITDSVQAEHHTLGPNGAQHMIALYQTPTEPVTPQTPTTTGHTDNGANLAILGR